MLLLYRGPHITSRAVNICCIVCSFLFYFPPLLVERVQILTPPIIFVLVEKRQHMWIVAYWNISKFQFYDQPIRWGLEVITTELR